MKKIIKRTALVLMCIFLLTQTVSAAELLIPGGQLIGLELADGSVTVAAFDDTIGTTAKSAGLKVGDKITKVDDCTVRSASDIRQALERSDGTVELSVLRDGKAKQLKLTPQVTADGPRLGIYLKQGVTGVGTVTWYDPDSGCFGALGHGVNTKSGELIPMRQGKAYGANIVSVKKGQIGEPGQLVGTLLGEEPIGVLSKNTVQGVFGRVQTNWRGQAIPTGTPEDVKTGAATIRSTVSDATVQEYSVEILKIYPNSGPSGRNMLLKVTDPELLSTTGGIVQGMSGSPLIQDGKLIGAVTHVLVNDPTMGYGIFIENMLDAAS